MNDKIKECEKCGVALKKSGPDASTKKESMPSNNEPMEINYCCRNEKCEMLNENKKVYIY